jgi:protein TonB
MSKVSVFNQEWIDLVFEGRNKNYGAYKLRQEDSKTTLTALFSGIALMGILVGIPVIANSFNKKEVVIETPVLPTMEGELVVEPVELPKKVTENKPAAPAPKPKEPEKKFTSLVPTPGPGDEDLASQDDLKKTNPGDETTKGSGEGIDTGTTYSKGGDDETGTGKTPDKETGNETVLLALVDEAPEFPGGNRKFLNEVRDRFNIPSIERVTTISIIVSFVVEKDGTISNIRVLRDPGYGMKEEAIRALKSIKTKWKPGKKQGQPVRTAYSLPIEVRVKN